MVDESIRRAVCEACEWKYSEGVAFVGDVNGPLVPWSDVGDAIAALDAWRHKRSAPWWRIDRGDRGYVLLIEKSAPEGQTELAQKWANDLPTAACEAIAAAWAKMKEQEDA